MKLNILRSPRKFKPDKKGRVVIRDFGSITIEADEQITLRSSKGANYDIVAKSWGYYATPSINSRLMKEGYKTALVKNSTNRYFIMLVEYGKTGSFKNYLRKHRETLIEWLDERN